MSSYMKEAKKSRLVSLPDVGFGFEYDIHDGRVLRQGSAAPPGLVLATRLGHHPAFSNFHGTCGRARSSALVCHNAMCSGAAAGAVCMDSKVKPAV